MGLEQVATTTVTSAVSSVTLNGINDDSVYKLVISDFIPSTDAQDMKLRVVQSGTPNTSANYDLASVLIRSDTTAGSDQHENATSLDTSTAIGNDTGECANFIFYIYNAFSGSEYTLLTQEAVQQSHTALTLGRQGGGLFNGFSSVTGIQLFAGSGNIQNGRFTLFRIK
tara:strand:- start:2852 stop:3358 length:507 start_codon:yes stop_codon:yes gene_type:complete